MSFFFLLACSQTVLIGVSAQMGVYSPLWSFPHLVISVWVAVQRSPTEQIVLMQQCLVANNPIAPSDKLKNPFINETCHVPNIFFFFLPNHHFYIYIYIFIHTPRLEIIAIENSFICSETLRYSQLGNYTHISTHCKKAWPCIHTYKAKKQIFVRLNHNRCTSDKTTFLHWVITSLTIPTH